MTRGVGGLIQAADYNNIRDKMVLVMGTGSTGYGQTDLSSTAVSVDTEISEVRWDNLRTDLLRARQHQTGVDESANITNAANTTLITEAIFAEYDTFSTTITTDNRVCADNQRAVEALITSTPWTSNWNGILYHQVVVTFSTALQATYFFNAGGQIRFTASRTGTAANTKDTEWTNMLGNGTTPSGMGTIFFDYTQTGTVAGTAAVGRQGTGGAIGFYDLTVTNQQIFITTATAGSYVANDYNIRARVNTAFGSGTEPTTITFTIQFRDDVGGSPDEQVTGTLNSVCQMARPSGSNVSVTAPTPSQTSITTSPLS